MSLATLPGRSLSDRFARLLGDVGRTAAAGLARNRAATPMLLLLWTRLQRSISRFARLVERVEAGTVQPPRPVTPRPARERTPHPRLPGGFGWLGQMVPGTRVFGTQLQILLADPRMAELLEAAPQLGRILRPLCQMLGVPATPPPPKRAASPSLDGAPAPPDIPPLLSDLTPRGWDPAATSA